MPKQKLAEPPAQLYDALKRAAKVVLPDIVLDTVTVSRLYRSAHGRLPNILFPTGFTEEVVCRSLFDRRPILKTFADKYAVRSFVESVLGKDVLPELYWVTQTPADIV